MDHVRAGNDEGDADQRSDGFNNCGGSKHADDAAGDQQDAKDQRDPPVTAVGRINLEVPDIIAHFPDAQRMRNKQDTKHDQPSNNPPDNAVTSNSGCASINGLRIVSNP